MICAQSTRINKRSSSFIKCSKVKKLVKNIILVLQTNEAMFTFNKACFY